MAALWPLQTCWLSVSREMIDPEERSPDQESSDNNPSSRPNDAVPDFLRNWQVIDARPHPSQRTNDWREIETDAAFGVVLDGKVVPLERDEEELAEAESSHPTPIVDQSIERHDDVIILGLQADTLTVNPGATVTLQVNLLNNGPQSAVFHLRVEGEREASWTTVTPLSTPLQPGERALLEVEMAPGREPGSRAGEHLIAIVADSPDYPERYSRAVARLTITPYDEVDVGDLQPRRLIIGGSQQTAPFRLPISNQGNRKAIIHVNAQEITRACRFEFARPDIGLWQPDSLQIELEPGQSLMVRGQVIPNRTRWFGLRREVLPFRLTVGLRDQQRVPHILPGRVENRPVMGPWQIATALALLTAAGLLLLMTGLGGLLLLQTATRAAAPAAAPAPAPVIAVMLNARAPSTPESPAVTEAAPPPDTPVVAAPVVQADQVSAPGEAAAPSAAIAPSAQVPAAIPPAPDANMTYAEMFQLVASQYDLDWRMLAAQAYIESNFDSVALGADGDLGLMQILPDTWREWAPVVGANDPFDAYSNTLVAAAYLDYLRTLFGQRGYAEVQWMLVAYNWGPDKLLEHLGAGAAWEELPDLRRRYAERILEISGNIPLE